jgi:hypothetical protein
LFKSSDRKFLIFFNKNILCKIIKSIPSEGYFSRVSTSPAENPHSSKELVGTNESSQS